MQKTLAWTYFHWGGPAHVVLIANLFSFFPSFVAMAVAWRVASEKTFSKQLRRAWFILGMSFLMFEMGNLIWAYLEVVLQVEPFPSIADVFYLAFYPLGLWGLLALPGPLQNQRERFALWLDLFSVLTAAAMFVGYFIIVPTIATSGSDRLTQVLAAAYPIGSLFLTGGLLAVLYRQRSQGAQTTLNYLLLGMIFFLGSDFAFGYTSIIGTYTPGNWTDAGWNVAQLFFVLAGLRQLFPEPVSSLLRRWTTWLKRIMWGLPLIAVALSYGLVIYVIITNYSHAAEWLMAGALLLTMLVLTRQIVSPAFTDLPMRVKLILTFLIVSVLSVSLLAGMVYFTIRSNLEDVVGAGLKADVQIRSQTLGDKISNQGDLIQGFVLGDVIENGVSESNAHYTGDRLAINAQLEQQDQAWVTKSNTDPLVQAVLNNLVTDELKEFAQSFPAHTDLLLTDKYGAVIGATTRPAKYSQADDGWWQATYNDGQGMRYIGQLTFDPNTKDLSVVIAAPVHAHLSSEVIGIICATYNVKDMLKVLATSDPQTTDSFDLLLPGGQLLTSQGELKSLDPATVAHLKVNQNTDYAELTYEGTFQLVSQSPVTAPDLEDIDAFKNLGWVVIAHEEPAIAFAPLNATWRVALLTMLLVLFLTSGVAVILARVFIAPISRLTAIARQIATGDLSIKAPVESRDEIGTLADTFNSMLGTLTRTQQELQESETLYRSLVNYSPDMIALHRNGKLLFINPAGVKLLTAKSADELIGRPILDIVPPQDREYAQQGIEQTKTTQEPSPLLQQRMHRLDGTSFDAEFRAIPITYSGQLAIQFVMRDITERKEAETKIHQLLTEVALQRGDLERRVAQRTEELNIANLRLQAELNERQRLVQSLRESEVALREAKDIAVGSQRLAEAASRAKSEFLSRMSHELRTPMNAILGFAQLLTLSRKEPLTAVQKERVRQIEKGGQHLLSLINEILDISRIEAGRLQISPEPVSLRESIQEVLDLTEPLAASRNIHLQISMPAGSAPHVMADRQRLKQVLLNLLSNAVKYNREGGFVVLTCEATQADRVAWRISISDTGSGISSEDLKHLFIPFERLAADQSKVEGTGLGLALAKRLVELMHGQIGVESVLGQGSTFWIELPSAESQLDHLRRTGRTAPLPVLSSAECTILYIEDNIANFELVRQLLADYNHIELLWATDSERGVRLAHEHQPNLILLDLHLGMRDGSDVLHLLKQDEQTATIPVIIVSADATPGQIERLISMGAHAYLTKPLNVKHLMQFIEELLIKEY